MGDCCFTLVFQEYSRSQKSMCRSRGRNQGEDGADKADPVHYADEKFRRGFCLTTLQKVSNVEI